MKNASKYWPIVMKKIISKSAQEEKNETAEVKSHLMSGKCMALKFNLKENMNRRGSVLDDNALVGSKGGTVEYAMQPMGCLGRTGFDRKSDG